MLTSMLQPMWQNSFWQQCIWWQCQTGSSHLQKATINLLQLMWQIYVGSSTSHGGVKLCHLQKSNNQSAVANLFWWWHIWWQCCAALRCLQTKQQSTS